jgi:hypothetical protein
VYYIVLWSLDICSFIHERETERDRDVYIPCRNLADDGSSRQLAPSLQRAACPPLLALSLPPSSSPSLWVALCVLTRNQKEIKKIKNVLR